jgi:hypothetical protein
MSEMIERVARAMYRQRISDLGIYGDSQEKTDQAVDRCWPFCSAQAGAAIAAMREPTVEMEIAGTEYWALKVAMEDRSAGVWQAMVDAALGETR